ncbi:hypothetical protein Q5P01_000247 [Channa striata]|uniref:Uncharacterized protein n=1 Tax=Channa striata TaxID=64152 RepID=A0AA88IC91_CHASR|nr:hypothetical protein Q5P01_000247 [Channa striata]
MVEHGMAPTAVLRAQIHGLVVLEQLKRCGLPQYFHNFHVAGVTIGEFMTLGREESGWLLQRLRARGGRARSWRRGHLGDPLEKEVIVRTVVKASLRPRTSRHELRRAGDDKPGGTGCHRGILGRRQDRALVDRARGEEQRSLRCLHGGLGQVESRGRGAELARGREGMSRAEQAVYLCVPSVVMGPAWRRRANERGARRGEVRRDARRSDGLRSGDMSVRGDPGVPRQAERGNLACSSGSWQAGMESGGSRCRKASRAGFEEEAWRRYSAREKRQLEEALIELFHKIPAEI